MIPRILSFLTQPDMPSWLCTLVNACTASVPEWMFLQWQPQLLALMSTASVEAITHTLARLCKTYPQALLYTVILARDQLREATHVPDTTKKAFDEFEKALGEAWVHGNRLLKELFQLHDPDLMVRDLRDELVRHGTAWRGDA
jgi:hypothetical protein